ncbi:hypothetical protein N9C96_01290 [bacterium]|nr:hypothetical protein [bacterium]
MRQAALFAISVATLWPAKALAHASDQSFVLLLPTGAYTAAGVTAVVLTVAALFLVPERWTRTAFAHRSLADRNAPRTTMITSLASFIVLAALVALGFAGPRSPLENLLPLTFWTLGWVALVSLCAVMGNLWTWLNPWTGLYQLIGPDWRQRPIPQGWGQWPALVLLIGFTAFLLADIAPDDPARLAGFVAIYWCVTMAGYLLCGPSWMAQVELGHAICGAYGRLAAFQPSSPGGVGGPGWHLIARHSQTAAGFFALSLLAAGSFDGLNETFWWLGTIGVNPLEFPGRSAVILPTLLGLLATIALLFATFAATVWLGLRFAKENAAFTPIFGKLALSLLPIAFVYHVAHYLPSFLVSIQYATAALSDPLGTGADLLGIQPFNVTTGFFNRLDTVRFIWLSQAGLVVLGHVWSVLLAHRIALDLFAPRRAAIATLPLSIFMIAYTFLGLWLLAAPRGA